MNAEHQMATCKSFKIWSLLMSLLVYSDGNTSLVKFIYISAHAFRLYFFLYFLLTIARDLNFVSMRSDVPMLYFIIPLTTTCSDLDAYRCLGKA